MNNKRIASKIFLYSILFFYIPTLIIGVVLTILFKYEENLNNKKIINNSLTYFEKAINQKKYEGFDKINSMLYHSGFLKKLQNKDWGGIKKYFEESSKKLEINGFVLYTIINGKTEILCKTIDDDNNRFVGVQKALDEIYFFDSLIYFNYVFPVSSAGNSIYYIYAKIVINKNCLESPSLMGINFKVIDTESGKTVFNTKKIFNPKDKENSFYFISKFRILQGADKYKIEVEAPKKMYSVRFDRIKFIAAVVVLLWIISTGAFFILMNNKLVVPLGLIIDSVGKISKGNYDDKLEILNDNEIGDLANKINEVSSFLKINEEQINSINQNLEIKIFERTKSLKEALEKLREYNNQKTDLFHTIVHDIKNPLTVINGYATMILQYPNFSEDKKKDFVKKIVRETERLTKMLNDFLVSIREEENLYKTQYSPIDILPILEYFYTIYEVQAKESTIDFVWDVQTPLPLVNGNKEKIEHVLSNLLSNAFKFTEDKGMIKISARVEENVIKVGVADTGSGIEEGKEKAIFDKFKKLEDNKSGTGLGLYIASQIIANHNGSIWAKNNVGGKGCTFYFTLPYIKDEN